MELIKSTDNQVDVRFSREELLAVGNSLNEVCHGIKVADFEKAVGVSYEQAKILLNSINELWEELNPTQPIEKSHSHVSQTDAPARTIKEICTLQTRDYQVKFFIRSLDNYKNSVGLGIILTVNPDFTEYYVKSKCTRISIMTLKGFISHLENHITDLQEDPEKIAKVLNYIIFKIQAMSGKVASELEGHFTLQFMVNTKDPEDSKNPSNFVSHETVVSFANVRSFTAKFKAVLDEIEGSKIHDISTVDNLNLPKASSYFRGLK